MSKPYPKHGRNMWESSRNARNDAFTQHHSNVMSEPKVKVPKVEGVVDRSKTPYQFELPSNRTRTRVGYPLPSFVKPVTTEHKRPVDHKYKDGLLDVHVDCNCVDCIARSTLCAIANMLSPHTDIVIQRIVDVVKLHPKVHTLRNYIKETKVKHQALLRLKDDKKIYHASPQQQLPIRTSVTFAKSKNGTTDKRFKEKNKIKVEPERTTIYDNLSMDERLTILFKDVLAPQKPQD